ncbi:MAG: hypothetical protein JWN21_140 [Sphingomonas bacterium]|uniref:O-antigen polymerase n=1 Tax=Sphingomonas bacterium TaxID=1895847 RepID=UPI002631A3AA|nr:O-antigen polymerase [Sphingomonas bacterium]MDB5694597.1 hypothetical protein [Sphingomonas bacterium]
MIGATPYEFMLVVGVLLWAGTALWYVREPFASIYHPITHYLVFHGVLFAIRPVLAHVLRYDELYAAMKFQPSWADKMTVLAAANLGLIVFVSVAARVGGLPMSRAPSAVQGEPPRFDAGFWTMIVLCVPPAIWSLYAGLAGTLVGAGSMIVNMETGATVNTTGNGYYNDVNLMLGPIAVLIAWTARFRWWSLLPLLVFILARAGTGGRWPFVMAVLSCASLWAWERRLRWPAGRLIVAAIPLFALFTVIGEDRGRAIRSFFGGEQVASGASNYFTMRPLESMDFGNMEFFEYMVHTVPAKTGTYDYFLINAQIVTEPIPRVLWSGKPQGAPFERLFIWRYGTSVGATMAIPGEGWRAAGWIGVVLWTAFFAFVYGRIYNAYVASRQDWVRTALFMLFMPVALQCFRDGLLLSVLKTSFFAVVPVLIWWGVNRLVSGSHPAGPPRVVPG